MSIQFEQITKRYQSNAVLSDVSLEIRSGEFFVLLGPSGSGKSTLLRAAAGLTSIDHGRISLQGRDVTHVSARQRGVGLVFQNYALFRHMTVAENVEFALRVRSVPRAARLARRTELLKLVSLEGLDDRLPAQLSGGQQQRVAVARALAHEPSVLLLDEPFGALDAKIRVELRATVRDVQRRLGMTTILVTHDQEEAFALGDRIGVMQNGRLLECGPPEQLYRRPTTRFVATFLGAANLLLASRVRGGLRLGEASLAASEALHASADADEVITVVRPEDIEIAAESARLQHRHFAQGEIEALEFNGQFERARVRLSAQEGVRLATERVGTSAQGILLEVARAAPNADDAPLAVGHRVSLGLRRVHALPTPISSFKIHARSESNATLLRSNALLQQLASSMRAPIELGSLGGPHTGLALVAAHEQTIEDIVALVANGARRVLAIRHDAPLPARIVIHCNSNVARTHALSLVASAMRHVNASATFVSLRAARGGRQESTSALRELLDARAELREAHGLDVRTDLQIDDIGSWARGLATQIEPTLVALGFEGTLAELRLFLRTYFQELLGPNPSAGVLLSLVLTEPRAAPIAIPTAESALTLQAS